MPNDGPNQAPPSDLGERMLRLWEATYQQAREANLRVEALTRELVRCRVIGKEAIPRAQISPSKVAGAAAKVAQAARTAKDVAAQVRDLFGGRLPRL